MSEPSTDALGRTPITDGMKRQIATAFATIPDGKRGALVIVGDETGARAHVAAKVNGTWKVAGGAGAVWREKSRGSAWIAIEGSW